MKEYSKFLIILFNNIKRKLKFLNLKSQGQLNGHYAFYNCHIYILRLCYSFFTLNLNNALKIVYNAFYT